MDFEPTLFIGVGETGAFFTLRETYIHISWSRGEGGQPVSHSEVRSYHHFNLAQDADEALAKAKHTAENMGMRLSSTRASLDDEMRAIQRATAEQLAERQRISEELQRQYELRQAERLAELEQLIGEGVYPIGLFARKPFDEASPSYINWLVSSIDTFEDGSIIKKMAAAVQASCAHLLFPVPDNTMVVGQPKSRLECNVTVIRKFDFVRPSFSGYGNEVVYITTMVTDTGACLVCFSTAFCATPGDKLSIRATVKEHSEYEGQAQTIIQRVKVLEAV